MCVASDAIAIISFIAERRDHQERHSQSPSSLRGSAVGKLQAASIVAGTSGGASISHMETNTDSYGEQSCMVGRSLFSSDKLPGNRC